MQKKTTMTKKDNYATINIHKPDNWILYLLCSIIILSGLTIQYPDKVFLFLLVCSANEEYLLTTHPNPRLA